MVRPTRQWGRPLGLTSPRRHSTGTFCPFSWTSRNSRRLSRRRALGKRSSRDGAWPSAFTRASRLLLVSGHDQALAALGAAAAEHVLARAGGVTLAEPVGTVALDLRRLVGALGHGWTPGMLWRTPRRRAPDPMRRRKAALVTR